MPVLMLPLVMLPEAITAPVTLTPSSMFTKLESSDLMLLVVKLGAIILPGALKSPVSSNFHSFAVAALPESDCACNTTLARLSPPALVTATAAY